MSRSAVQQPTETKTDEQERVRRSEQQPQLQRASFLLLQHASSPLWQRASSVLEPSYLLRASFPL